MSADEQKKRVLVTGGSGFIGANLISALLHESATTVLDLSITAPLDERQSPVWRRCNILERDALFSAFREFRPHHVIHLAARAECDENTTVEGGYRANTEGTRNVIDAIKATPSVLRFIITSSQFVCGPGHIPRHDEDFAPVTVYGQSKVIAEQLTRASEIPCTWTIVRPTNIWGPWHMRYKREFWQVIKKGLYVHPGGAPVIRCYGYVGNVVLQMLRILELPPEQVHRKVFYLSDPPDDILKWVNAFSLELRGAKVRVVPRPILAGMGLTGDLVSAISRKPFYITSSRYRSMTSDYVVPMDRTYEVLGSPPISLEEGVWQTAEWLRQCERRAHSHFRGTEFNSSARKRNRPER